MRELERYKLASINVLPINHLFDAARTEGQSLLLTHNDHYIPAHMVSRLEDVFTLPAYGSAAVIGIDECQFYSDLFECVLKMIERDGKIVYLAGLDGTFERKKFGQILDLVPYCDTVTKLAGVCKQCSTLNNAIFSKSYAQQTGDINVGGAEKYHAVCRRHFLL